MQDVECRDPLRKASTAVGQREVRTRTGERVRRLELRRATEAADKLSLERVIGRSSRMIPERDVVIAEDAKLTEEVSTLVLCVLQPIVDTVVIAVAGQHRIRCMVAQHVVPIIADVADLDGCLVPDLMLDGQVPLPVVW